MTTALILAAGEQVRWELENPFGYRFKQLLPVGSESIIARIVRQCRERRVEPLVVTHKKEIAQATDAPYHIPVKNRWTVETLLHSPLNKRRVIVLLGDVIYSKSVMDRIFKYRGHIRVFGSEYEIFAISFSRSVLINVQHGLRKAIQHAENGGPGKLRKFYQAYCNLDLDSDCMETAIMSRVYYMEDYTQDVDSARSYKELLNKVVKGGLLDDC